MMKYETTLLSPTGEKVRFALAIEQSAQGLAGTMSWGDTEHAIKNVRRYGAGLLYAQLFWTGTFMRTWLTAYAEDGQRNFGIRPMGQSYDYTMTEEGYTAYLAFVEQLQVGSTGSDEPIPAGTWDEILDQAKLRQTSVCLYQGSNIYKNMPVRFSACAVDGAAVDVDRPSPLPYDMGSYIGLGHFERGQIIVIEWVVQTWNVQSGSNIALGAFRDGSLTKRTVLGTQMLEPFKTYQGTGKLTV